MKLTNQAYNVFTQINDFSRPISLIEVCMMEKPDLSI